MSSSTLSQLADLCIDKQFMLATAESCTGGMVSAAITDIAGSSQWLDRGFVTYSNDAKMQMLGVQFSTLEEHGAVSEPVVLEMAKGAVTNSKANFAVSISGIAGPGGGTADKPVGLVCFGVSDGDSAKSFVKQFDGDRAQVREQACEYALSVLLSFVKEQ